MGWFSKKKVPKVPFPEGHVVDSNTLRFPSVSAGERVIEPSKVKEAVGVEKARLPEPEPVQTEVEMPEEEEPEQEEDGEAEEMPQPPSAPPSSPFERRVVMPEEVGPLFVKVDVYQRILGELDQLKQNLNNLQAINKRLQDSEYNEEGHFAKLRKNVKVLHDKLLQVDRALFKAQED